jgi:hypothetical protein
VELLFWRARVQRNRHPRGSDPSASASEKVNVVNQLVRQESEMTESRWRNCRANANQKSAQWRTSTGRHVQTIHGDASPLASSGEGR